MLSPHLRLCSVARPKNSWIARDAMCCDASCARRSRAGLRQTGRCFRAAAVVLVAGMTASLAVDCPDGRDVSALAALASGDADCNGNGIPDACDITPVVTFDDDPVEPLGFEPSWLEAADFDADGDVDYAAVDAASARLVVLKMKDGAVADRTSLAVARRTSQARIGDVNGDGHLDIVVGGGQFFVDGSTNSFSVFFGDGGGGFAATTRLFSENSGVVAFELADVDADGRDDLIFSGFRVREVGISRGRADDLFAPIQNVETSTTARAIAPADFDADGHVDIALAVLSRNVPGEDAAAIEILWGSTEGTFESSEVLLEARNVLDIAAGDVDGDGRIDLVADTDVDRFYALKVVKNNGARQFRLAESRFHTIKALRLEALQLQPRGKLDVLMMTMDRQLGHYTFDDAGQLVERATVGAARVYGAAAFADVDGDGDDDLAFTHAGGLSHFRNLNGRLRARQQDYFYGNRALPGPIVTGDFDGDGHVDFATSQNGGDSVEFYWNDGTGVFDRTAVRVGRNPFSLSGADFDGDGRVDLACEVSPEPEHRPYETIVVITIGPGRLPTVTEVFAAPTRQALLDLATGDFNGDNLPDLALTAVGDPNIRILSNEGSLRFAVSFEDATPHTPAHISTEDFDGDGNPDCIVLGRARSELLVYKNVGGSFDAREEIRFEPEMQASRFDFRDLTGDGVREVSFSNGTPGRLWMFRQSASGHILTQELAGFSVASSAPVAALQGFGADLFVATFQGLYVLVNEGSARFSRRVPLSNENSWFVESEDFNGDRVPDLVFAALAGVDSAYVRLLKDVDLSLVSRDTDGNGIPDECQSDLELFVRGDVNANLEIEFVDAMQLLDHLFDGRPAVPCRGAADANDDGRINLSDGVLLLTHLFRGGVLRPPHGSCGFDPTADGSALGCDFPGCAPE